MFSFCRLTTCVSQSFLRYKSDAQSSFLSINFIRLKEIHSYTLAPFRSSRESYTPLPLLCAMCFQSKPFGVHLANLDNIVWLLSSFLNVRLIHCHSRLLVNTSTSTIPVPRCSSSFEMVLAQNRPMVGTGVNEGSDPSSTIFCNFHKCYTHVTSQDSLNLMMVLRQLHLQSCNKIAKATSSSVSPSSKTTLQCIMQPIDIRKQVAPKVN